MFEFINNVWLGNTWLQYLQFIGIIIAGILIGKIFYWISKNVIKKITDKTKSRLDDLIVEGVQGPIIFLLFTAGFHIGSQFLVLGTAETTFANITKILITVGTAWGLMNVIDALIENYLIPAAKKSKSDLDDALVPVIRKGIRITIILVTVLLIIDNFGYDITSLIAGLGLGGLAFALAAKDMLSNLFGGVAIITDKPFKVGDRIRIDEKNDGFIREIGMRSTRMETLDGTLVIVPNSVMANSILENVSNEQARKIKQTISVTYDTSNAQMEKAKKIIAKVIEDNVDTKDNSLISFFNFGDSALEILVIYWIKNFDNILGAKDRVNMEIKKQFEKAKIEFAYPTQVVYMKK